MSVLQLPAGWQEWDDDSKREIIAQLTRVRDTVKRTAWQPYPWQHPHEHEKPQVCDERCLSLPELTLSSHEMWLLFGGRGTGKTDGAARFVAEHVRGPACDDRLPGGHRIAIIAPTLGDAVESCVNGPSGLATHFPGCKVWTSAGGTFVRFPSTKAGEPGALAKVFGASTPEDVERLRAGGNRCLAWWEELAAWRRLEACMEHSRYGLRVGPRPVIVASTTPKPRKAIVALTSDKRVHVTRGRTKDAVHLDETVRDELMSKYAGTRSGRQELDGELLTDVEGALWTYAQIDAGRTKGFDAKTLARSLARIVVAIDPAVTNTEESDETGIVVAGRSDRDRCPVCGPVTEPHGFVLADLSGRYGPSEWATIALRAHDEWEANEIVAEVNNGGDLVGETVHAARARAKGSRVAYRQVRASRGKRVRAEPVAVLYGSVDEKLGIRPTRVHHVGAFPELEDQQTTWTHDDDDSPDRMDANVWALTQLLVKRSTGKGSAV